MQMLYDQLMELYRPLVIGLKIPIKSKSDIRGSTNFIVHRIKSKIISVKRGTKNFCNTLNITDGS